MKIKSVIVDNMPDSCSSCRLKQWRMDKKHMIKIVSEEDYEKYKLETYKLMDALCNPERQSETAELEKRLVELTDAIEEYEKLDHQE